MHNVYLQQYWTFNNRRFAMHILRTLDVSNQDTYMDVTFRSFMIYVWLMSVQTQITYEAKNRALMLCFLSQLH